MTANGDVIKHTGRIVAGAYYDFQDIRKGTMNRVRDIIRKKAEGIPFDAVEDKKEENNYDSNYTDDKLLARLEEIRDKLTDKEYQYMRDVLEAAVQTHKMEDTYKKLMESYVQSEPIYQEFLQHIKGIGPVLSANLIKEFGYCETYEHVSSLWKHCGYHVVEGHSPRLRKGKDIEFNPRLRTLAWKIGKSLMQMRTPLYRQYYEQEKKRQLNKEYEPGYLADKYNGYKEEDTHLSQGHAHNRAQRHTAKMFLEHYWVAARDITGQETGKPWIIEHGGHDDNGYIHYTEAIKANIEAKETKQ